MIVEILVASVSVALLSLLGIFFFGKQGHLVGSNRFIIPVAIGVFLGVVFFELIPETLEAGGEYGSLPIAFGFIAFYLLSYVLHTYHHHHDAGSHDNCEDKAGASMLLLGDAVHNIADGIVIATAFMISPVLGVATTVGVALHEIPQEIAEFGVLLKAGYSVKKAALFNLLSASSVVVGALATYALANTLQEYVWILTGLAAGNLLYIAASDLLPDVHEESRARGQVVGSFIATLLGMLAIMLLLNWAHGEHGHDEDVHEDSSHTAESSLQKTIEESRKETEAMRNQASEFDGPLEAI